MRKPRKKKKSYFKFLLVPACFDRELRVNKTPKEKGKKETNWEMDVQINSMYQLWSNQEITLPNWCSNQPGAIFQVQEVVSN